MTRHCAFCGDLIEPVLVFGRMPLGRRKRLHDGCRRKARTRGKGKQCDDLRPDQIETLFQFAKARAQYARRVAS